MLAEITEATAHRQLKIHHAAVYAPLLHGHVHIRRRHEYHRYTESAQPRSRIEAGRSNDLHTPKPLKTRDWFYRADERAYGDAMGKSIFQVRACPEAVTVSLKEVHSIIIRQLIGAVIVGRTLVQGSVHHIGREGEAVKLEVGDSTKEVRLLGLISIVTNAEIFFAAIYIGSGLIKYKR